MDIINFLFQTVRSSMAFLFGSTGEILTEKSGHLNLGIPGTMCVGAAFGCCAESIYVTSVGGIDAANPFLAVLLPILATFIGGGLMGLIYCFLAVTLRANQNVTGLVLTTLGIGVSDFMISLFDRKQILHGISPVCGQTRCVRQTHILLRRNGLSFHCCRSYLRICS